MTFKAAICPSCGGALQLPDDRATAKCMYCGVDVIVREAIQTAAVGNIENWLKIAGAASQAGNYQEAYHYFTRVLEVDGNSCKGWLGKAEAAGYMSTGGQNRLGEMLTGFRHALECAPQEHRKEIDVRIANAIVTAASSYYREMRASLSPGLGNPATYQQFTGQVIAILSILEEGHKLLPQNTIILRNIIDFCAQNNSGIPFVNMYTGARGSSMLPPHHRANLQDKQEYYLNILRRLDPSIPVQSVSYQSSGFQLPKWPVPVWVGIGFGVLVLLIGMATVISEQERARNSSSSTRTASNSNAQTPPNPTSSSERLASAKRLIGPAAKKADLDLAEFYLKQIPQDAPEYKEVKGLLASIQSYREKLSRNKGS